MPSVVEALDSWKLTSTFASSSISSSSPLIVNLSFHYLSLISMSDSSSFFLQNYQMLSATKTGVDSEIFERRSSVDTAVLTGF